MKNFKTILSFLIFTLLFTGIAASQGLGFKAGLNLTNVKFDPDFAESDSKIGFQIGAFYEFNVGETLVVRPGLSYSAKGLKEPEDDGSTKFNYLDVPIDVVYKFDVGTNKVSIHAGPYVGILLSASDNDGDDIKDQLKNIDFGLNIGAAYELTNIMVGINYGLGLSNILDDPDAPEGYSAKNTNLSITVGYRL